MRAGWILVAALMLLLPAPANAEWQIRPFLGLTFGGTTTFRADLESAVDEKNLVLGITGALVGDVFGLEVDVARAPGYFESNSRSGLEITSPLVLNSSVTTLTGNVTVAVPRRMVEYTLRPYFVGGAGLMSPRTTDTSGIFSLSRNMAAIDLGGGATGFVTRRVGLNWEIRHFQSINGRAASVDTTGEKESLSFWRATMALAFRY
jgi:hypothetical protein